MKYSFNEWLEDRVLLEVGQPRYQRQNEFMYMQQKAGDFVYFGVHDLSKFYKENGYLPNLSIQQIIPKMGQVVDASHVDQTITVSTNTEPYKLGYHKLESAKDREKRKKQSERTGNGTVTVSIPVSSLQEISHMLEGGGTGAQLSNHSLWLVIDEKTAFQKNLMKEIRKKEIERTQGIDQSMAQTPQSGNVTPDQVDRAREFLMAGQQPQQQTPTAASLFGDQPQYQMHNREIIKTTPQQMQQKTQQRQDDEDIKLDLAHILWKSHSDLTEYNYFPIT